GVSSPAPRGQRRPAPDLWGLSPGAGPARALRGRRAPARADGGGDSPPRGHARGRHPAAADAPTPRGHLRRLAAGGPGGARRRGGRAPGRGVREVRRLHPPHAGRRGALQAPRAAPDPGRARLRPRARPLDRDPRAAGPDPSPPAGAGPPDSPPDPRPPLPPPDPP